MRIRFVAVLAVVLIMATLAAPACWAKSYMRVYYLDWAVTGNPYAGYGDAIFIELPGVDGTLGTSDDKYAIVDGGSANGTGTSRVDDFLSAKGITRIDYMFLSHSDGDHVNGLQLVADQTTVKYFYATRDFTGIYAYNLLKPKLNADGATFYFVNPGDILSSPAQGDVNKGPCWDPNIYVKIVAAYASGSGGNDESVMFVLKFGLSSFVFGGDSEGNYPPYGSDPGNNNTWGEGYAMTNYPSDLDVDIFKAHHHGSNSHGSNSTAWLNAITPKITISQDGGSPEHPNNLTLARVIASGSSIYRNDLDGHILVKCDNEGNYDVVRETIRLIDDPLNAKLTSYWSYVGISSPPVCVTDLTVNSASRGSVQLKWTAVRNSYGSQVKYDVYYSTVFGGDTGAGSGAANGFTATAAAEPYSTGIYKKHNAAPVTSGGAGSMVYYTADNLTLGQPSYFRVASIDPGTMYEHRYSNEVIDIVPPSAISNLTALTGAAKGTVTLKWTAPGNDGTTGQVDGYVVKFAKYDITGANFASVSQSPPNSGTLPQLWVPAESGDEEFKPDVGAGTLANGVTYYFAIEAYDGVNYGQWRSSSEAGVNGDNSTWAMIDTPPAKTILTALAPNECAVNLSWTSAGDNGNSGALTGKYRIQYTSVQVDAEYAPWWSTAAAQIEISASNVTPGAFKTRTITSLNPNVTYYFRLWTCDEVVPLWSDISPGATAYVRGIAPAKTNLSAATGSAERSINLNWTSAGDDGISGPLTGQYRIQYTSVQVDAENSLLWSTSSAQVSIAANGVAPGAARTYTVVGLNWGATYYFRLWTRDEVYLWSDISTGATAWAQFVFSTPPVTLNGVEAVDAPSDGGSSVIVSWQKGSEQNINGYRVYYSKMAFTNVADAALYAIAGPDVSSVTVTGLETGTADYYFAVTAANVYDNFLKTVNAVGPVRAVNNVVSNTNNELIAGFDPKTKVIVMPGTNTGKVIDIIKPGAARRAIADSADAGLTANSKVVKQTIDLLKNTAVEFNSNSALDTEVTITISYAGTAVPADIEEGLRIFALNENASKWEIVDSPQTVDKQLKTASVTVGHFSVYRIVGYDYSRSSLAAAYLYPNPFKPAAGAQKITLKNLTGYAKISIFNIAGELVFDTAKDDITDSFPWLAVNSSGERVASGTYLIVIKDSGGSTKVLKVLVIR